MSNEDVPYEDLTPEEQETVKETILECMIVLVLSEDDVDPLDKALAWKVAKKIRPLLCRYTDILIDLYERKKP